ncbi:MAG: hypothetical protein EA415_09765 [Sphaerobacteraceae bacterium]|nr:MAG: hypothetical protein EA415_09765 [Sphaerobacteraceae bacterium]
MTAPPDRDNGLTQQEIDYLAGRVPDPEPEESRIERWRPGWLVAALTFATFGLYLFIWTGVHWAEMKRQLKDERMYPVWHALAITVPIYCYFRLHSNYRVMNELLATTSSPFRTRPMLVLGTFLMASLLLAVPMEDIVIQSLNLAAVVGAISWILHHGQTGMNAYWEANPSVKTSSQIQRWEKIVLFMGGFLWWMILSGLVLELAS